MVIFTFAKKHTKPCKRLVPLARQEQVLRISQSKTQLYSFQVSERALAGVVSAGFSDG